MNKTKIDYADATWNPITGCRHGCDYCYAKKICERYGLYGGSFEPQFHPMKLGEPFRDKKAKTIFVCDMGDIFSPGVKEEWRKKVRAAADKAPWHTYLWLTKNPNSRLGYDESWVRPNWWLGATITGPEDAYTREVCVGENVWYSYEPLFGCSEDEDVWDAKQVVIGRATNHKSEWCLGWARHLTDVYTRNGTKVLWKKNIGTKGPRELAWNLTTKEV